MFLLKAAGCLDIGFDWFNHHFDIEKTPLQSIGLVAGLVLAGLVLAGLVLAGLVLAFLRFPVVLKFQPACADRSAVAGERPCTAVKQLEDLAASISRVVR